MDQKRKNRGFTRQRYDTFASYGVMENHVAAQGKHSLEKSSVKCEPRTQEAGPFQWNLTHSGDLLIDFKIFLKAKRKLK